MEGALALRFYQLIARFRVNVLGCFTHYLGHLGAASQMGWITSQSRPVNGVDITSQSAVPSIGAAQSCAKARPGPPPPAPTSGKVRRVFVNKFLQISRVSVAGAQPS